MRSVGRASPFNYCYWSIAIGDHDTAAMDQCIRSARLSGIYHPFQVMTDRELNDCDCYDAMDVENPDGMARLIYLKAAMARLSFDYFVWIEPNTHFHREPRDPLSALCGAPLHVPLCETWPTEGNHEEGKRRAPIYQFMLDTGLPAAPYFGSAAFCIIHHQAIELVASTAIGFWRSATDQGISTTVDSALAFTMQLFCGDRRRHRWSENPELWLPRHSHFTPKSGTISKPAIEYIAKDPT